MGYGGTDPCPHAMATRQIKTGDHGKAWIVRIVAASRPITSVPLTFDDLDVRRHAWDGCMTLCACAIDWAMQDIQALIHRDRCEAQ